MVRDGQRQEVGSTELLVGDVMLLSTGDILPADGMLFEGNDIRHAQPVYPLPCIAGNQHQWHGMPFAGVFHDELQVMQALQVVEQEHGVDRVVSVVDGMVETSEGLWQWMKPEAMLLSFLTMLQGR